MDNEDTNLVNIRPLKNISKQDTIELFNYMVNIRREIHKNPELSGNEYNTQQLVINELSDLGVCNKKVAGTGVFGTIEKSNPAIAIRAELDALKVDEKINKPYKSKVNGVSHSCGHDVHTAVLLGVAKFLSMHNDFTDKTVNFLFQPDEECNAGATKMIEDGCIQNTSVIFSGHVQPYLNVGEIEYMHGVSNATSTSFFITINGKSGHGAYPHSTVDPIVVASNLVLSLQTIVSRNVSPTDSLVISVCTIKAGTATNQIPSNCTLSGTIRALSNEVMDYAIVRINELLKGLELSFNVTTSVAFEKGYPLLINKQASKKVEQMLLDNYDKDVIKHKKNASLGVEDFAFYLHDIDGMYVNFGCKLSDNNLSLHNENFDVEETCMLYMLEYYLLCIKTFE